MADTEPKQDAAAAAAAEPKAEGEKAEGEKADQQEFQCATCDKTGAREEFKRCARCKLTTYCTRECQTSDWKKHKKTCRTPFQRREDENMEFFQERNKRFRAALEKYGLDKPDKAELIAAYMMGEHADEGQTSFTPEDFAKRFGIDDMQDAADILAFIKIGVQYKESNMRWVDGPAPEAGKDGQAEA